MHMYIRISIWIRKLSLDQESNKRKANRECIEGREQFQVFCFAIIASVRVSKKLQDENSEPFQVWIQNAIINYFSDNLVIFTTTNAKFCVCSPII